MMIQIASLPPEFRFFFLVLLADHKRRLDIVSMLERTLTAEVGTKLTEQGFEKLFSRKLSSTGYISNSI